MAVFPDKVVVIIKTPQIAEDETGTPGELTISIQVITGVALPVQVITV